ncbi:MAG: bifunctional diaminohydroxyphosphoribosylaminopyrimidine deaminase/5-amino-6-(5-phosphoribosylamino)uracil reductase RibD, partial [Gemmatimonadota bacterium]
MAETALRVEAAMDRALALAARAGGRTSPNPMVGAVALDALGGVLAEGFHSAAGEPHAEAALLSESRRGGVDLRGATLVVNLEPCAHRGRTPPCAPRLVEAGFVRVVTAMRDPDPRVDGRGVQLLRSAGVDVQEGVREDAARRLNEGFVHRVRSGRPFVHLKVAMLPDGIVHRGAGGPAEISGPEARRRVHLWRHLAPAVLVGGATVRTDDPRLTVRELPAGTAVEPWQPRRVVLSARLDLSLESRALLPSLDGPPPLVIAQRDAPLVPEEALRRRGVDVARVRAAPGGVDLDEALDLLGALGVSGVLVEGGPLLTDAFLAAGLAQRLSVFTAG